MKKNEAMSARESLLALGRGFEISQCIFVAAQLNIADFLAQEPKSYQYLAERLGVNADALYLVMRVLDRVGVFSEIGPPGTFGLADLGCYLQSNMSGSLRNFMCLRSEQDYPCSGALLYSVKTGQGAFEHVFGLPRYQYFLEHPDAGHRFDSAMADLIGKHNQVILDSYDFSRFHTVVDVGGGSGSLIANILSLYPTIEGVLFDRPNAFDEAKNFLSRAGVLSRCNLVGGNFFIELPGQKDLYIFKHVLHDWTDEEVIHILRHCRKAMHDQSLILIVERLWSANATLKDCLMDLREMQIYAGRTRSQQDFETLFSVCGLALKQMIPTASDLKLIEVSLAKN